MQEGFWGKLFTKPSLIHQVSFSLFKQKKEYTKQRISFILDDAKLELDTLEDIPTYLEIEAPTIEKVRGCVEKLGFKMTDTVSWTSKEVVEHYNSKTKQKI